MPTLTIDLPDAAYRAALAIAPQERARLVAATFAGAETGAASDPMLSEEDFAAIGQGLAELARGEGTPGDVVFARLRAKHGFPRSDNTFGGVGLLFGG